MPFRHAIYAITTPRHCHYDFAGCLIAAITYAAPRHALLAPMREVIMPRHGFSAAAAAAYAAAGLYFASIFASAITPPHFAAIDCR